MSTAAIILKLDDNLKQKLIRDLAAICSIEEPEAVTLLESHDWNIQAAIDSFLGNDGSTEESDEEDVQIISSTQSESNQGSNNMEIDSSDVQEQGSSASSSNSITSPEIAKESNVEKESEVINSGSNWAPESFSIMSWNLDSLDPKNLQKRIEHVLALVFKENHDVLFFQELIPSTFEFLAEHLENYIPVPGTDDPIKNGYFTATFLRLNRVIFEEHKILEYPNSLMGRTLLITKAFIGRAKLYLLNTHLESTGEHSDERMAQLGICFEQMKSFLPEYNVIFGGDLNLRDKEVEGLITSGIDDLWIKCGSRPTCRYTWDLKRNTNKQMPSKFQPRCRFDRLYFRGSTPSTINPEFFGITGIEKVDGCQSFPSDHWAIISFFKLEKEARKPYAKKRKNEDSL